MEQVEEPVEETPPVEPQEEVKLEDFSVSSMNASQLTQVTDPEAEVQLGEEEAQAADSNMVSTTETDSTAVPRDGIGLIDLYRVIEARYPETEYAARAEASRTILEIEMGLVAVSDEQVSDAETVADDGPSLPQTLVDGAPEGTFGLLGSNPFDMVIGGFSWRVAAVPSPLAAQALLNNFLQQDYRAAATIEQSERGEIYVLLIGQFPSEAAARTARNDLPSTGVGRNLEVVSLEGLSLITANDLGNLGVD